MTEIPRVTEILRAAGLIDMSNVPQDILERAQKFGTALHKTTELWDKGILDIKTLSKPLIPYLEGWKKFIKDYNIVVFPNEIEKQFISAKYNFRGTPDRWPVIRGRRTLIDIKSSTTIYASTEIQLAGYQILLEERGIKIYQRWGLQLLGEVPKGKLPYNIEPYTEISDKTTFLNCLGVYNYKKRRKLL